MSFKGDVVAEDWRSAVISPLYECKGERTECRIIGVLACSAWLEKYKEDINRKSPKSE